MQGVAALMSRAYAGSTVQGDIGHFAAWTTVCRALGTSEWRVDQAANSGFDPEGHQEEVFLLVAALVRLYAEMLPRDRSHPAALPSSAVNKLYGVARVHKTKLITMASMSFVTMAAKAMMRDYIEEHCIKYLMPQRKLPLSNAMIDGMLATLDGAQEGELRVRWGSYHWIAVRAAFATMAETGMRKDEVAKKSHSVPFRLGRLTFASLVWKIGGVEVPNPTLAQLSTMREGDGVWFAHGVAKNDPFAAWFAATPSFLPYSVSGRCACRELAALEMASMVPDELRARTPLFGPSVAAEFTHAQLIAAFELLMLHGAKVDPERLRDYSLHSFRIFLACALLEQDCPHYLIKRLLRWRGDDSLEIYARVSDTQWGSWLAKSKRAEVDSSLVSRLPNLDFSEEQAARFREVALKLVSLSAKDARSVASAHDGSAVPA